MYKIVTLNLGTASTKVGLYEDEKVIDKRTINHVLDDMKRNPTMRQQVEYRKAIIFEWLSELGESISNIDAFGIRGAALPREVLGGTYLIDGVLKEDLSRNYKPDEPLSHGSEISLPLAESLANGYNIPFYLTDPANINELAPEARISGHPLFERDSVFHALNQKMVGRMTAKEIGKEYKDCNMIIAHMGGGVSVCAHEKGIVIEANNCAGEDGCFSATRTGDLPARQLINLCFSGTYTKDELLYMTRYGGGVLAYLGTNDMREVERRIEAGDKKAELIFNSMAYKVAKEIGGCFAVLKGKVDAIVITGGISNSKRMTELIKDRVSSFAPIFIYPDELESEALAAGALRILRGEEKLQKYPKNIIKL